MPAMPIEPTLFERFKTRAEQAHTIVHPSQPRATCARFVRELLAGRAAFARAAPSLDPALHDLAPAASVSDVALAEAGVCEAELAVAETGSLVLARAELLDRLVSMLPPVCVVLVAAERFVPSLGDAAVLLRERTARPSYLSFVTGPSRTADIELVHTIGVHGPARVHVVPYHGK